MSTIRIPNAIFLSLAILAFACGLNPALAQGGDKPVVVATVSMIADVATIIMGDKAQVECIVPIGGDPHLYEPTPKSAKLVNGADLVLMNGLTFEGWLSKLIENSGTQARVVTVSQGVEAISSLDHAGTPDPHAWMDAQNGIIYATNITKAAQVLMPAYAEEFNERFLTYKEELLALDEEIKERISTIPEKQRLLITSHDAFQYYGRAYGLQLEASMGTSTDADVKTSDMLNLQKAIRKSGVPAIFVESTINPKLIQQLAKDNGIRIGGQLYADSLGPKGSGADTYTSMLRKNTLTIVEALTEIAETPPQSEPEDKEKTRIMDGSTWLIIGGIVLLVLAFLFLRQKTR